MSKQYWLMKSEPEDFSFEDLKNRPNQREPWDGIRNYQARNFMRDSMSVGDGVLFYHSNTKVPGVIGLAEIVSEAYPDPTQFDKKSKYYDPKSDAKNPRWILVDLVFKKDFKTYVTLEKMKQMTELANMKVLQKGNRLSITPVSGTEFEVICDLGLK